MKKRIVWIDLLKIIGMFGVILMHVIGNTIDTFGLSGYPQLLYRIIANSFYFTMTLFVMITGGLLLNKDLSYKDVFIKYIRKMILILLLIGGLFAFMEEYYISKTINISIIGRIINRILTGQLWAHMWYIYMLIALYLITPLLRAWIKNTSFKEQAILLVILFAFLILRIDINYLFNTNIGFYMTFDTGFVFIYLLGYYLYNYDLSQLSKYLVYIFGIISFLSIIVFSYFGIYNGLINYTSTLCIIVSSAIFLLFKNKSINNKIVNNIVTTIGEYSLGIYIFHQLFINIIYKVLKFNLILKNPYALLIPYVLGIFLITFLFVYIVRKSKLIRKYLL